MKNTTIALCALAALAAVACSKRTGGNSEELRSKQISITSSVDGDKSGKSSKSVALGDALIDDIQLLRKDGTTGAAKNFTGVTPIVVKREANTGKILFEVATIQSYNVETDENAYFMAYHPAGTGAINSATWTPNGETDILVSELHNAGKYTSQIDGSTTTNQMKFNHVLTQVAIVLVADLEAGSDETLADVQKMWGQIESITMMGMPSTLSFNYATGLTTVNATPTADIALLRGANYTSGNVSNAVIEEVAVTPAVNSVQYSSMLVPSTADSFVLNVKNSLSTTVAPVTVNLVGGLLAGFTHTITLKFGIDSKVIKVVTSSIKAWEAGTAGSGEIPKPPVVTPAP